MVPVLRVPLSCSRLGTGWQHSHWLGITKPHFLASTGGHSTVVTLGCAMKHSFDAVTSLLAASLSKILVNWSYSCMFCWCRHRDRRSLPDALLFRFSSSKYYRFSETKTGIITQITLSLPKRHWFSFYQNPTCTEIQSKSHVSDEKNYQGQLRESQDFQKFAVLQLDPGWNFPRSPSFRRVNGLVTFFGGQFFDWRLLLLWRLLFPKLFLISLFHFIFRLMLSPTHCYFRWRMSITSGLIKIWIQNVKKFTLSESTRQTTGTQFRFFKTRSRRRNFVRFVTLRRMFFPGRVKATEIQQNPKSNLPAPPHPKKNRIKKWKSKLTKWIVSPCLLSFFPKLTITKWTKLLGKSLITCRRSSNLPPISWNWIRKC